VKTVFSLAGRIVLVSGASSGLGARFAELCARAGASVALGARRTDRTATLATRLGEEGLSAISVPLDVTSEESVIAAYDRVQEAFGTVDTIIVNAGINAGGRSVDVPADDVRSIFDTNVVGAYLTAREGARRLIAAGSREHGRGRVVMIGSVTAHMTGQGDSAYCASKAALATLGRNFAREWVRLGINVNTVQPGYMRTDIMGDWFDTEGGQKQIRGFHRRRLLEVEALDDMILYLASDASHAVTGAVFDIDDGQSL
jgi:NAD(P)-dependent dehydrogenase (short-subunit alcohol dehydrogenase family)